MLGYRFVRDLIEHGADLLTDMCLKIRGHTLCLLRARCQSPVLMIAALPGVYGHTLGSLLFIVSVHSGSLSMLFGTYEFSRIPAALDQKTRDSSNSSKILGTFGRVPALNGAIF